MKRFIKIVTTIALIKLCLDITVAAAYGVYVLVKKHSES